MMIIKENHFSKQSCKTIIHYYQKNVNNLDLLTDRKQFRIRDFKSNYFEGFDSYFLTTWVYILLKIKFFHNILFCSPLVFSLRRGKKWENIFSAYSLFHFYFLPHIFLFFPKNGRNVLVLFIFLIFPPSPSAGDRMKNVVLPCSLFL